MNEAELQTIAERMGEAAHNAWMEKRRKEKGWHSPEECPNKGDIVFSNGYCEYCHPCMRPYSELPDSEKELDKAYPIMFLKMLNEIGYIVVNKDVLINKLVVDITDWWNNTIDEWWGKVG